MIGQTDPYGAIERVERAKVELGRAGDALEIVQSAREIYWVAPGSPNRISELTRDFYDSMIAKLMSVITKPYSLRTSEKNLEKEFDGNFRMVVESAKINNRDLNKTDILFEAVKNYRRLSLLDPHRRSIQIEARPLLGGSINACEDNKSTHNALPLLKRLANLNGCSNTEDLTNRLNFLRCDKDEGIAIPPIKGEEIIIELADDCQDTQTLFSLIYNADSLGLNLLPRLASKTREVLREFCKREYRDQRDSFPDLFDISGYSARYGQRQDLENERLYFFKAKIIMMNPAFHLQFPRYIKRLARKVKEREVRKAERETERRIITASREHPEYYLGDFLKFQAKYKK